MRNKQLRNTSLIVIFILLALALPLIPSRFYKFVLALSVINAIMAMGLHFIFGLTGQLFVGPAGFMGIGSYILALGATRYGWGFWTSFVAAALGVGLMGLFLGIPTLRLKRYYLAITTTGFAEITRFILMNWTQVTGGVFGIFNIPRPSIGGFVLHNDNHFYYFSLALAVILGIIAVILEDSKYGEAFRAVHDDELAVDALGISSTRIKIIAFVLCGIYIGLGAALYASFLTYISPEVFNVDMSYRFVTMILIGGIGSLPGAIIGSVLLTFLPEMLRFLQVWYLAIYGLIVLVIIIYQPGGIMGGFQRIIDRRRMLTPAKEDVSSGTS
ncbi:MAG: branched-chain amino acid ABC transporter permease [Limnochordia bacterium]|jgi:branched-chain amino acid transport system permease protein